MVNDQEKVNPLFLQLVLSLQSAAMFQMGKTASPISGKIEKDMTQAKISIDLLTMLQEKTAGNLQDEEKRFLDSAVYNLQMNYIEELNREQSDNTSTQADDTKKAEDEPPSTENDSTEASDDE
jgi:uncharacterized protein YaaW (UPF0174 family)